MDKDQVINCKTCQKETMHTNYGKDIPIHKRFKCQICRTDNKPKDE